MTAGATVKARSAPTGAVADLHDVMRRLEAAGTEQNRKIYRRHGAREPMFGVSFGDLRAMAKSLRRQDTLARGLWATGNSDARLLACMVADPAGMSEADLDAWLADMDDYVLVDVFVASLASRVPGVRERWVRWAASDRDWTAQAGWDLLTRLALDDLDLDDAFFDAQLDRIRRELPAAGDRTRHAMNGAVIAIGMRDAALRRAATDAATAIGPIIVDHGETGCVTPAAIPYIDKAWARREAKTPSAGRGGG
jgi:hypothetical protein